MEREQRIYFRDMFRDARASALADAEGFQDILFAIERLGSFLHGKQADLGKYEGPILDFLRGSGSFRDDDVANGLESHVATLYGLVREARNFALHQGAFARQLTANSLELAIIIETALNHTMSTVADYAIRHPVCAAPWHPLSFVRQTMLASSFSFLPVDVGNTPTPVWRLIGDAAVAAYLRRPGPSTLKDRLRKTLRDAIDGNDIELVTPLLCKPDTHVYEAITKCQGLPILVVAPDTNTLIGMVTPFDLI